MSPNAVIGIDLGTTHCAMARATLDEESAAEAVEIVQLVGPSTVEAKRLLPSFLYFGTEAEGALALPWDEERSIAVGELARARAVEAPARVVSSAKSWLCHPGVDRRGSLLPQGAAPDIEAISPVEASYRYLDHLAEAYAQKYPGEPLSEQEIIQIGRAHV